MQARGKLIRVENAREMSLIAAHGVKLGIAAALALSDQGLRAFLVERQDQLGGNLRRLPHLLEDEDPKEALEDMIARVEADEDVEILMSSELVDLSGVIGNFDATIRTPEGDRTVHVGAIVVATGAYELEPDGEYDYGKDDRVMTAIQAVAEMMTALVTVLKHKEVGAQYVQVKTQDV